MEVLVFTLDELYTRVCFIVWTYVSTYVLANVVLDGTQEFQEEAALWEDRLTKLNAVLDAWVDVQRKWIYLEGIFFASRDIKQQLPAEFAVCLASFVFFFFVIWFYLGLACCGDLLSSCLIIVG